ncbi:MAG: bifunctional DNA primase/polymerase, partial [Planctomycetes bacterium]|nr:bifunctional DNA primase/polymerase [Planctomycetota bacterium]
MESQVNGFLSAALHYAELGYVVFPCRPGTKKPLTKHGFQDASTDPDVIRRWWKRWPHANIGIATEGLLVVDIDGKGWLADEPEKRLDLDKAPVSVTPRGGTHHLFRQPPGKKWRNTSKTLAAGIDTRADGGYIVAPPSVRAKGAYVWANGGLYIGPGELPGPPEWLIRLLDALAKPARKPPSRVPRVTTTGDAERRALAYLDA